MLECGCAEETAPRPAHLRDGKFWRLAMAIHIRVVTPITTQGFRTSADAAQLESEGVKVDFVNIDTGPASIECDYEIMLAQPGTVARIVEAERHGVNAV